MFRKLPQTLGLVLFCAAMASAAVLDFSTSFGPEVLNAQGSGSGLFRFDTINQTLSIDVTWSGLRGTTTIAHIHCCVTAPGLGTAAVAVTPGTLPDFPVGVTGGTYQRLLDLTDTGVYTSGFLTSSGGTAAGASSALLKGILDGKAYFNIHSTAFLPGEIRGFLQPVPEPDTAALAALTLLGLFAWRRKRAWVPVYPHATSERFAEWAVGQACRPYSL